MSNMCSLPDHPVIRHMERYGRPDGRCEFVPVCPLCNQECDTIYLSYDGDVAGCDCCIQRKSAWSYMQEG